MAKCEFEEKQFEQHLNNELLQEPQFLYVPGQVLEGHIGFDAAVFSLNPRLWSLFNVPPFGAQLVGQPVWSRQKGVEIRREWWSELEQTLPHFPRFRFNVFLQHKRPDHMKGPNAGERSDWNRSYFRYNVTRHQQRALEQLETHTRRNALVVYSAPAFATLNELWEAIETHRLVELTNFCQPSKLSGHTRYSYAEPGNKGCVHSKSEKVESFRFHKRLLDFIEEAEQEESNEIFIRKLGLAMKESVTNCGAATRAFDYAVQFMTQGDDSGFHIAMARITAFNFVLGTSWMIRVDADM